MRKKINFYVLIVIIAFILYNCSSNNTTGPNTTFPNYLPTSLGSYWVYDLYNLDSAGNRINIIPMKDSTIISGTTLQLGLTGSIYTSYITDSTGINPPTDAYYRTDSSKIYAFTNLIKNMIPSYIPIQINDAWILLIKGNAESGDLWNVYEMDFKNDTLGLGFILNGTLKVIGSYVGTETVLVNSQNMTAKKFLLDLTFLGTVTALGQNIPVNFERKMYQDYVENIGLVKSHTDPLFMAVLTQSINMPGEERILKNYYIAH